ncbi:MAG: alpha/beta hydrolase-fold protein [Myxococcota bacterium]
MMPATVTTPRRRRTPSRKGQLQQLGPFDIPHVGSRLVRLYLPPGYHEKTDLHPLLVMWDGQNVYDDGPSFAGGWHLHEALDRRAARRKQVPVVAAIDHGGGLRIRELAPYYTNGEPLLDPLLDWVTRNLLKLLHDTYRLKREPEFTYVGGSSLGGLASLYAHFRHPQAFGGCMAMSPSLFLGRGSIFRFVESQPKPWRTKVYVDGGGNEMRGTLLRMGDQLAGILRAKGYNDQELMWRPVKRGAHNERHWRARLPKALRFLYG